MGGLAYGVEGVLLTMCDAPQGTKDPWGDDTVAQTAYLAGDGKYYDLSKFSSSKVFMEEQSLEDKEAYLEYVYNDRQEDLKKWLNDPNNAIQTNNFTYLGLPSIDGRNIPLYPEWDVPVDSTTYKGMMDLATGNQQSPKPTWWMWMAGQNPKRPLVYAPGGIISGKANAAPGNYLTQRFGFGFATPGTEQVGRAMLAISSKQIQIDFPSWVSDCDVLVEYVNCGPVAAASPTAAEQPGPQYGLGSGLFVNKGPIMDVGGSPFGVITINSASQPWPETGGVTGTNAMIENGEITDVVKGGGGTRQQPIESTHLYQHLSYSVCLPQFQQTKFNVGKQNNAGGLVPDARFTPKFGACFYPTVKFTIIGYEQNPVLSNNQLTITNNFTMVQNGTSQVDIGRLLIGIGSPTVITYQQIAPFSDNYSVVSIPNVG